MRNIIAAYHVIAILDYAVVSLGKMLAHAVAAMIQRDNVVARFGKARAEILE